MSSSAGYLAVCAKTKVDFDIDFYRQKKESYYIEHEMKKQALETYKNNSFMIKHSWIPIPVLLSLSPNAVNILLHSISCFRKQYSRQLQSGVCCVVSLLFRRARATSQREVLCAARG